MKTPLYKMLTCFVASFTQLNTNAYAGSYLFCANEFLDVDSKAYLTKGDGWKWAKGEEGSAKLNKYQSFARIYKNKGFWIEGVGSIATITFKHFLSVSNTFETKQDAIKFCKALQSKCIDDFGSKFTHVGVSSYSIPQAAWGTISVPYSTNPRGGGEKWIACPNWRQHSQDYPELNYKSIAQELAGGVKWNDL